MGIRTALVAGTMLLGWVAVADAQPRSFDPERTYAVPVAGAPTRGPDAAPITIVEFSDFTCRYCVRAQQTLDELRALYPGQLRLVFRNNPLDPEDGTTPAEASLAAGEQGQYWAMHHRLFANPVGLDRDAIEGYAAELGLDLVRFRTALDERRFRDAVLADSQAARTLGLASTPMFFVNGRPVKGAQPISVFAALIDEELARVAEMRKNGVAPEAVYEQIVAGGRPRGEAVRRDPVYPVAELEPTERYRPAPPLPGHSRGADAPLVVVVELSDFECGYCAIQAPRLRALEEKFPGEVRIEYRHLPLAMHPNAQLAAEAAVVAGDQGKFWQLHDLFFTHEGPLTRPVIEQLARQAGLDMRALRAALDDRRHRERVMARAAAARTLGISGTPTVFVNGTPVVGAVPLSELVRVVEEKRDEAQALIDGGVSRDKVIEAIYQRAGVVEKVR